MRFVVNRPSSCRTIYIPGPLHPEVECEAEKTFGKILRSDGTQESRDACLEECEGIRGYRDLSLFATHRHQS